MCLYKYSEMKKLDVKALTKNQVLTLPLANFESYEDFCQTYKMFDISYGKYRTHLCNAEKLLTKNLEKSSKDLSETELIILENNFNFINNLDIEEANATSKAEIKEIGERRQVGHYIGMYLLANSKEVNNKLKTIENLEK